VTDREGRVDGMELLSRCWDGALLAVGVLVISISLDISEAPGYQTS
jgi:hypothetical protein